MRHPCDKLCQAADVQRVESRAGRICVSHESRFLAPSAGIALQRQ